MTFFSSKQSRFDTVLRFKTVFSASRCLSTTNFRTWSITMLHDEQNNMPSSTWNVPGRYFLVLSFAVMFTRFRRRFRCFNNKLIHSKHQLFDSLWWLIYVYERNYILQAMIKLFLRRFLHTYRRAELRIECLFDWSNARSQTIDDF